MSMARETRRLLLAGLVLMTTACAEPPDREMQQAQGAIDAARAAGADVYAAEEFDAAQVALRNAEAAVDAGDYRLALNHAVDSRDRAQQAARMAADGLAMARVEADRAITRLSDALVAVRQALEAATGTRAAAKVVAAGKEAVSHGDGQLQEARTAFDRGDYDAVMRLTAEALPRLQSAATDLAAAPSSPARRGA